MKQTVDDLRFAGDFAEALRPHVLKDKENGRSLRQIAGDLGITEPALKKCLSGQNTPCLRTVVLAFDKYGLAIPYSGIALFNGPPVRRRRRIMPLNQLVLPFEIETPRPNDRLTLKLLPKGDRRYQLQMTLRVAN